MHWTVVIQSSLLPLVLPEKVLCNWCIRLWKVKAFIDYGTNIGTCIHAAAMLFFQFSVTMNANVAAGNCSSSVLNTQELLCQVASLGKANGDFYIFIEEVAGPPLGKCDPDSICLQHFVLSFQAIGRYVGMQLSQTCQKERAGKVISAEE